MWHAQHLSRCDYTNDRRKSACKTITHTHPPLTAPPLLGCNNTMAQRLNMSAQLTFNTTKPPLILCSSRSRLYLQGIMPMHQAIACAVDHGNHQLQEHRRRSVLRPAIYECQIICNQLNRVQILRSISSC